MVNIHPNALVSDKAEIADGVKIGPFTVVEDNVKIGLGTVIGANALIHADTTIGENCKIFNGASIGTNPQDLKYDGEKTYLEIGNNNVIREFCTFNRGTEANGKTVVGDNNLFMAYCHVAHDCIVGNNNVFANNATLAGHVEIADNIVIGGLSAIHQFCRVGRNVMVGGMSKILQDVPPFTLVEGQPVKVRGINAVGLRRSDMERATINEIKKAIKILCHEGHTVPVALERIKSELEMLPEIELILDFVSKGKRGLAI